MSVIVLFSILLGIGLIIFGFTRKSMAAKLVSIAVGLLLQSWWVGLWIMLMLRGSDT